MSYYPPQPAYLPQDGQYDPYDPADELLEYLHSSDGQQGYSSPAPDYGNYSMGHQGAPPGYAYGPPYQQDHSRYPQPPQNAPYYTPPTSSSDGQYDNMPQQVIQQRPPQQQRYSMQGNAPQGAYMHRTASRQPPPMADDDDEVTTPSLPRNKHGIPLRPVSALPDIYRGIFKFGVFNAMQSKCFDTAFNTDENMVISAPTGSGKTVIFELAIIRLLIESDAAAKCVYMAPTKALCSERFHDWTAKFQGLGISCCELTGDTQERGRNALARAKNSSIIITTPEKWDSLTRNWSDNSLILGQMKLFLVDEVHILNDLRGSTLEVCLARMRQKGSSVRFVLLSATVPNVQDVANWIGDSNGSDDPNIDDSGSATVLTFGEEFRPCPIQRFVYGFPRKSSVNDFQFNATLDFKIFELLQAHVHEKPALIFCATRKGTVTTAEQIVKEYKALRDARQALPWPTPKNIEAHFQDKALYELACCGVGVHHAGIHMGDRRLVEQLFTQKQLRVVVATSTLAVGVNFPAHTVIIKGTKQWQDKGWTEYTDLDVMQMIGRAGRPQFDKEGVAVIMTETAHEARYNALVSGKTFLESSLHLNLTEHINSEIKLGTIASTGSAKKWIRSTFLCQRIQKNPRYYCMGKDEKQTWKERLDELVDESLKKLEAAELISVEDGGQKITSTEYGDIMSRYYIRFHTMCMILQLQEKAGIREILEMISNAVEFQDIRLRSGERGMLESMRKETSIRFPPQKVQKVSDKIFIILQAVLGGVNLNSPDWKVPEAQAPHLEAMGMFKHAPKLAKALAEVGILKQNGHHIKYGMELMRSLNARTWEDRPGVLTQFDQIGEKSLITLQAAGIRDIPTLRKCEPGRLENLLNRNPPFGRNVMNSVKALPEYTLSVEEVEVEPSTGNRPVRARLQITIGASCEVGKKTKGKSVHLGFTSILTVTTDIEVMDFRRIPTKSLLDDSRSYEVDAFLTKPSQKVLVSISGDNFAGLTVTAQYEPRLSPTQYPTMDTRPARAAVSGVEEPSRQPADDYEGLGPAFWKDYEDVADVDFLDLTGDDDGDIGRPRQNRSVKAPANPVRRAQPANSNNRCKHTCQDKRKCKHPCCKIGLPSVPLKAVDVKKSTPSSMQPEQSSTKERPHLPSGHPIRNGTTRIFENEKGINSTRTRPAIRSMPGPGQVSMPKAASASHAVNSVGSVGVSSGKRVLHEPRSPSLEDDDSLPDMDTAMQDAINYRYPADEDEVSTTRTAVANATAALSPMPLPQALPQTPPRRQPQSQGRARLNLRRPADDTDPMSPVHKRQKQTLREEQSVFAGGRRDRDKNEATAGSSRGSRLAQYANSAPKPSSYHEFSPRRDRYSDHTSRSTDSETMQNNETPLFMPDSDDVGQVQSPPKPVRSSSRINMPMLLDNICTVVPSSDDDMAEGFADPPAPSDVPLEAPRSFDGGMDEDGGNFAVDDLHPGVGGYAVGAGQDTTEFAPVDTGAEFNPADDGEERSACSPGADDYMVPVDFGHGSSSDAQSQSAGAQDDYLAMDDEPRRATQDAPPPEDLFSLDDELRSATQHANAIKDALSWDDGDETRVQPGEDPFDDFEKWMNDPTQVRIV